MKDDTLLVHEIFYSIQGESTWSGLPCSFVRLSGCPLRCHYCDTSYAFEKGDKMHIKEVLDLLDKMPTTLVEITGGEPLIQANVHLLMEALLARDFTVLLETSGERDISTCDARIHRIVDIKTPESGEGNSFRKSNYAHLAYQDEVKFVIMNRADFDWALGVVKAQDLLQRVRAVHFSPVMEQCANSYIEGAEALDPEQLAHWILESTLPIRMHLQVHKYIWTPLTRGV